MDIKIGDDMGLTIIELPMFQDKEKEIPSFIGPEIRSFCEYWKDERDVNYKSVYADYEDDRYLILVREDLSDEDYKYLKDLMSLKDDEIDIASVEENKLFELERIYSVMESYFDLKKPFIYQAKESLMKFLDDMGLIEKAKVVDVKGPESRERIYKYPIFYIERLDDQGRIEESYPELDVPAMKHKGMLRYVNNREQAIDLAKSLHEQDGRRYIVEMEWFTITYDHLDWDWRIKNIDEDEFHRFMSKRFEEVEDQYIKEGPKVVYDTHRS